MYIPVGQWTDGLMQGPAVLPGLAFQKPFRSVLSGPVLLAVSSQASLPTFHIDSKLKTGELSQARLMAVSTCRDDPHCQSLSQEPLISQCSDGSRTEPSMAPENPAHRDSCLHFLPIAEGSILVLTHRQLAALANSASIP